MKKFFSVFLTVVLVSACALSLGACALIDEIRGFFDKTPGVPVVTSYANIIMWDETNYARHYNIYVDGEEFDSTEEKYYIFNDVRNAIDVTVKAVNEKDEESEESNSVVIQQNTGFSQNEIQNINLEVDSGQEIFIEPGIKYVTLSGKADYRTGITIRAERTADLIIELNNVTMTSQFDNNCIRTENNIVDAKDLKFTVILKLNGDNTLTGLAQADTPSPQTDVNSGKKGTTGTAGRSAIVLPTVVFLGSGSLQLNGGNGGNGGTGAPSSGISASMYGSGGDGGAGGSGLICTTAVLAIGKGSRIAASGGTGGKGGSPGSNGDIVTGMFGSLTWSNHFGNSGADGKAYVGNLITISGQFQ